jgi:cytosine/adenosine deaminase-related metal-dependent hydrolase
VTAGAGPPARTFNAHCHLELSHLHGAIRPGLPFVDWLDRLVSLKLARGREESAAAARRALKAMHGRGVAALLDIDAMGTSPAILADSPVASMSFSEVLAVAPDRCDASFQSALNRQRAVAGARPVRGLSPHAPYSVGRDLIRRVVRHARDCGQVLCIHCAEIAEETQMLQHGRGPLLEFLRDRGLIPPNWQHPGLRPVEYLHDVGALGPDVLLVHLNDLTEEDLRLVASTGTRAVVCPGTHVYFGRGPFPLERLLRAGVTTYLGTDSLASNDALDMEREARLALELCPRLQPGEVWPLIEAARAADFGLGTSGEPPT